MIESAVMKSVVEQLIRAWVESFGCTIKRGPRDPGWAGTGPEPLIEDKL